jgi:hypothetical protein
LVGIGAFPTEEWTTQPETEGQVSPARGEIAGKEGIEIPNPKSQISNIKQITMTKIQNSKPVLVIEYWNLRFVCNLVLGI